MSLYTTVELLRQDPTFRDPAVAGIAVTLLALILPLALRRRFPRTVACAVIVTFVVGRLARNPGLPGLASWEAYFTVWACWLALYSAVAHRRRTPRTAIVVTVLAGLLFAEVVREVFFYRGGLYRGLPLNQGLAVVYNATFIALPLLLGAVVRTRRDREAQLAARTAELQRERVENARHAVLEERVRIARELHDVGGHGLVGMRERVGLHGGHLRAGPTPHGGFAVRATFPFDGDVP